MKYCVGVYLECVVEADSVNEAADEAKEQATTFFDDINYVEAREVYLVDDLVEE